MKRMLIILCLCLVAFTSFGKKVVVIEVHKDGTGWQNFFNCYQRVTTTYQGTQDGVTYASLDCLGSGYNWCRASNQIGGNDNSVGGFGVSKLMSNNQVIDAVNALIAASETSVKTGASKGTSSKKVAIVENSKSQLYFIRAEWKYDTKNATKATMVITIEMDESNMLGTTRL